MTTETPSKTRSTAAALAVILPVVLTSVASFVESQQAKADVATQSEKHQLDEARNDIWIREQWVVQTKAIADLRAEVAELRGSVWRERRRHVVGDDLDGLLNDPLQGAGSPSAAGAPKSSSAYTLSLPSAPAFAASPIMPEKPARDTERVRKAVREMKR